MNPRPLLLVFFTLFHLVGISQVQITPFNNDIQSSIDYVVLKKECPINTSFKPYDRVDFKYISEQTFNYGSRDSLFIAKKKHAWIWKKLRRESLVNIDSTDYTLEINPFFNFTLGKTDESENSQNFINSRGVTLNGTVGRNFSFNTLFVENQAQFPDYIQDFVQQYRVVPGQGLARKFKDNGADYAYASGYFDYSPSKHFSMRFGHGKNFIGDGYRSLLLSDVASSYPYLMLSSKLWKLQYINLYSAYLNITTAPYKTKYSTSHYLIYRPIKNMSIGLFETIVWQAADSTNRGFDINYLNPIIFYHPINFNLGSPDNSLLGLNFDWKYLNRQMVYAQFVIDDFNVSRLKDYGFFQQKFGFQIGIRGVNLFRIKQLGYLLEYNQVQPYVYAHRDPRQNYTHLNQSLTHPLGANFRETVLIMNYKMRDFYLRYKLNYAVYGADTNNTHWGKNIFKSDYQAQRNDNQTSVGNYVTQGVKTTLLMNEVSIGYLINPVTNMKFELGLQHRQVNSITQSQNSTTVFISFKTDLFNRYYDF